MEKVAHRVVSQGTYTKKTRISTVTSLSSETHCLAAIVAKETQAGAVAKHHKEETPQRGIPKK